MPSIPNTPESLLPRSDSRNPATTCRGITGDGRPCRRAIAKSQPSSPSPSPRRSSSPSAYCHNHKDQATPIPSPQGAQPTTTTIRPRTSVDTLIDRLGIVEAKAKREERRHRKPEPRLKQQTDNNSNMPRPQTERHQRPKQPSFLGILCCIGEVDEGPKASRPVRVEPKRATAEMSSNTSRPQKSSTSYNSSRVPETLHRPPIIRDPLSRTGEFLSLIPTTATPQTSALLMAELAKPVSTADDEGFIYMFWLTPESLPSAPPSETVNSLLAPPSRPEAGRRRTSDVLSTFSASPSTENHKTMLLKIGRAENVHRRLVQWQKQCGYNLSLIRYYPYQPTSSSTGPPQTPTAPRKVPNVHKVERLIHIELASRRAQGGGKCKTCGREHREWFEVDANRDGVKKVDETVRRWVDWAERGGAT